MGKAVSIRITGKDDSKQAFTSVKGSMSSLKNSISSMSGGMKAIWNMAAINQASQLINSVAASVKDLISAYGKQEQAERKLGLTVTQNANLTAGALDRFKKTAADIQSTSIFGDETLIDLQSYLAGLDLSESKINEIIQSSADLASTGMISLEQAVKGMAQTITSGELGSLAEIVPTLKTLTKEEILAGKAVDFISNKYEGMAKTVAESSTGMMQQFSNTFGDMKERIGEKLVPAFTGILKTVTDQMPKFENAMKPVLDVFGHLGPLISAVMELGGNVMVILQPILDFLGLAVGGLLDVAVGAVQAVSSMVTATATFNENLAAAERRLDLSAEEGMFLANALSMAVTDGQDLTQTTERLAEVTGLSKDKIELYAYYTGIAEVGAGKIAADNERTAASLEYQKQQQRRIIEMYGLMVNAQGLIVAGQKEISKPDDEKSKEYTEWVKRGTEIKDNAFKAMTSKIRENELLHKQLSDTEQLSLYEEQRLQMVQAIIALENIGVTAGEKDTRYKELLDKLKEIEDSITSFSESMIVAEESILKPIEDSIKLKMFELELNNEKIDDTKKLGLLEEKRKEIIQKIIDLEKEKQNTVDDAKLKDLKKKQEELKKAQSDTEKSIDATKKNLNKAKSIWVNLLSSLNEIGQYVKDYVFSLSNSAVSYFQNLISSSDEFSSAMEQINETAKEFFSILIDPLISAIEPLVDIFLQLVNVVAQAILPIISMLGLFIQNTMPLWNALKDIFIQLLSVLQILAPPFFMFAQLIAQLILPLFELMAPLLKILSELLLFLMPIIEILAKALDAVSRPFEFLADVIIFVVKVFQTLAHNLGVFLNNLNPFASKQSYSAMPTFQSDAFSRPLISFGGYSSEMNLGSQNLGSNSLSNISGSTTNVTRAPDIYNYLYFQGPVVGFNGLKEVGEFLVSAIKEYVGAGGTVSFEGA